MNPLNMEVYKAMWYNPDGSNGIYTEHVNAFSDVAREICPCPKSKFIPRVGAAMGISDRFVKEHMRRFEACDIIKIENNMVYWMLSGGKKEIPETPLQKDESDNNTSIYPEVDKPICSYLKEGRGYCVIPGTTCMDIINPENCKTCKGVHHG